ncbi:hypothetical protein A3Q56_08109 [Intoshia linei]|uniref:Protein kinase domain-containing protein n=1 Tax=Intoshia linei TaxID=1819745 RepID=A0A177AS26_9BILA|nr:hypothetical protein A3Q56_08109 [Intoshia linei]
MESSKDCAFTRDEVIGHGAFAVVYKGRNKLTNTDVAIKSINKRDIYKSKDLLDKEIEILQNLTQLKHKNVVALIKCMQTSNSVCIITEV